MTDDQTIAALERARELLADPERVVLNPQHYVEIDDDGLWFECATGLEAMAAERRATCRVCMYGAATLAAIECGADQNQMALVLTATAKKIGIEPDEDVAWRWTDEPSVLLTSALVQGRALEVVDQAIADVRAGELIDTDAVIQ